MIPLQEIDIHTDKQVLFNIHLVAPTAAASFSTEVLVYDSEFSPPFQSTVLFHQQLKPGGGFFKAFGRMIGISYRNAAVREVAWINELNAAHNFPWPAKQVADSN